MRNEEEGVSSLGFRRSREEETRGDGEGEGIFAHHGDIQTLLVDLRAVGVLSSESTHRDSSVRVSSLKKEVSRRLGKEEHA